MRFDMLRKTFPVSAFAVRISLSSAVREPAIEEAPSVTEVGLIEEIVSSRDTSWASLHLLRLETR